MYESNRIDDIMISRSVKMMLFRPSGKKLWIVVGKDNEYWVDTNLRFCSCKDFYFNTLSGGNPCYHLNGVEKAEREKKFTVLEFADDEYVKILKAIADDSANHIIR